MIDSPNEIFGEDDARLFVCDDKDLKAKAIRNSIIPRLLEIIRECVSEVRSVYGIDALDVSTLCWSPHSAESRGNGYACDFRFASAGLEVKRVKGRPMRLLELRLILSRNGLWPMLALTRGNMEQNIAEAITAFVRQHEATILALIVSVAGGLFVSKNRHSKCMVDWFPLSESFSEFARSREFTSSIHGFLLRMPIDKAKKARVISMFTVLFPLFWAMSEIGEGRNPVSFEELVRTAFEYKRRKFIEMEWESDDRIDSPKLDNCVVEDIAEARTKVPVGRRWQVFERDNWHCVSCGRGAGDGAILEVDHILPRSKGGRDTLDNYQTLCRDCNIGKSNKSQKDLRKKS